MPDSVSDDALTLMDGCADTGSKKFELGDGALDPITLEAVTLKTNASPGVKSVIVTLVT